MTGPLQRPCANRHGKRGNQPTWGLLSMNGKNNTGEASNACSFAKAENVAVAWK